MMKAFEGEFTEEELAATFEGEEFKPTDPSNPHFTCDFCSKKVRYDTDPSTSYYVADDVLNENHRLTPTVREHHPVVPLASYCEECTTERLYFPCEGFGEVRMVFDLDEDLTIHNVDVSDVSDRSDGIPWDPKEFSEAILQIPFEANPAVQSDHLWGPENMVTFFMSSVREMDISEVIEWDGTLDPKAVGRARKKHREFREKMRESEYEEDAFTRTVRGEDDDSV